MYLMIGKFFFKFFFQSIFLSAVLWNDGNFTVNLRKHREHQKNLCLVRKEGNRAWAESYTTSHNGNCNVILKLYRVFCLLLWLAIIFVWFWQWRENSGSHPSAPFSRQSTWRSLRGMPWEQNCPLKNLIKKNTIKGRARDYRKRRW